MPDKSLFQPSFRIDSLDFNPKMKGLLSSSEKALQSLFFERYCFIIIGEDPDESPH